MKFRLSVIVIFICAALDSSAQTDTMGSPVNIDSLRKPILSLRKEPQAFAVPMQKDTSALKPVSGLDSQLVAYRGRKEFNYVESVPEGMNLWSQFWYWFWGKWNELMSRPGFRTGFRGLLWVLSIAILGYAVLRLMGMEKLKLWMGAKSGGQRIVGEMVEDIRAIDYPASIAEAENEGRYRDAIRFHFLHCLKLLAERGDIQWHRNKTNIDYSRELSGTRIAGPFAQIQRIYEYAWYGEFAISEADYTALHPYFLSFEKTLVS